MKKKSKDIYLEFERSLLAYIIRLEARLEALEKDTHPEKQFVTPGEFETAIEEFDKRLVDIESRIK